MKKGFRIYALVTQFLFQTIVLTLVGLYIGHRIDPEGILSGILAIVGALIGIGIFMYVLVKMGDIDGN